MRRLLFWIIQIFVFLTGFTGLVYQVAWHKYLGRILGNDNFATAIILSTFLGGLSIGYFICGKMTRSVKNQLKAYSYLEGVIGIWCLNFPLIFNFFDRITESWSFSLPFGIIIQGSFVAFLMLGVPTVCMGATVPFLTRGLSANLNESTNVHATVYAVNTTGASLGTIAAGFFLIPEFGLPLTVMSAGVINIIVFVFFFILSNYWKSSAAEAKNEDAAIQMSKSFPPFLLYTIAFLSGCYVMTLENLFIRIINLSFGSSSYSFALIVSVFILSIAVGSFIAGKVKITSRSLFYNQAAIFTGLVVVFFTLDKWPYFAHLLRIGFQASQVGIVFYFLSIFLSLSLVLVLPVSFMGATVPIAFHELKRNLANVGKHSGYLFAWNTVGNMLGSLAGGIVLFYFFDIQDVFIISIVVIALSMLLLSSRLPIVFRIAALSCVIVSSIHFFYPVGYNKDHFMLGTFRLQSPQFFSMNGPGRFFKEFGKGLNMESYDDGPADTVAVLNGRGQDKESFKAVIVNGKSDSNTHGDRFTLKLSAHLPAFFSKKAENALVVGLGTGVTAGELTLYDEIKQIDIAEISPSVINALPLFKDYNHAVHENNRINIIEGDAFRVLRRSKNKKWDIIISEPSNVWVTGIDSLFSDNFYKLVKSSLSDNGVFAQWMHIYSANDLMVGMVMNTLANNFEDVHAFVTNSGDLIIIATPYLINNDDLVGVSRKMTDSPLAMKSIEDLKISRIEDILIREIWPKPYIKDMFSNYPLQTLDNPRLHYIAGKAFFYGTTLQSSFLVNHGSVRYSGDYLLSKLSGQWNKRFMNDKEYNDYIKAENIPFNESGTYYIDSVKLKYIADNIMKNSAYNDYPQNDKFLRLPYLMSYNEKRDWSKSGLAKMNIRQKAEKMLQHVNTYRNWIAHYPVDGLTALLKDGVSDKENSFEDRNWFSAVLIDLLHSEGSDSEELKSIYEKMIRNQSGEVICYDKDKKVVNIALKKIEIVNKH